MNALLKICLLVALTTVEVRPVVAETPQATPTKPVWAHSVFQMPASARDGRDPFFPDSLRPYEESATVTNRPAATILTVKGRSIEHGHVMLIINNHTFAVGDEGDVLTGGKPAHLRLVEITADTAVVEVNGSRRELRIANK